METYKRFPISLVRGKGSWVWDKAGKKYLDAVAGIATCCLGHSDDALRRALTKQLNKIQHVSNLFHIPEQELLAELLIKQSCADKAFFCNSGAEANEAAIKLARKYGHQIRGINEPIILTAQASFHGRTLAALSATGQKIYHKGFEPLVKGFHFFEYNNINSFKELFYKLEENGPQVAAVLIEPLQAEGGIFPGNKDFFKNLKDICLKNKVLLIFDEVQTGIGRTGKWWGYQNLDIEPDAFTLAKGLGGGHAIGALLVRHHADIFKPGDHATTFGGNPFACKAAIIVIEEIRKRNLIQNVKIRSSQLQQGLNNIVNLFPNYLIQTRGTGLIQGLVIKDESNLTSNDFIRFALDQRLLLIPAGPKVIRVVPALTINETEINEILKRIKKTFSNLV